MKKRRSKHMFAAFAEELSRLSHKERGLAELDERDTLSPFRRQEAGEHPDTRRGLYGMDPVGYKDRGFPV